jgi:hypothetical protein
MRVSILSTPPSERPNPQFIIPRIVRLSGMEERCLLLSMAKRDYFNAPEKCLSRKFVLLACTSTLHLLKRRPFNPPKSGNTALNTTTCSLRSEPPGLTGGSRSGSNTEGDTRDSLNPIHCSPSFVVSSLSVPSLFPTKQLEHTLTVIAFNPPPVLFISGALHRNDELWLFLMDLEFWQPGPPKLIMRNYESPLVVSGPGGPVDVPFDEDIITAPNPSPGPQPFELASLRDFCDLLEGCIYIKLGWDHTDTHSCYLRGPTFIVRSEF